MSDRSLGIITIDLARIGPSIFRIGAGWGKLSHHFDHEIGNREGPLQR